MHNSNVEDLECLPASERKFLAPNARFPSYHVSPSCVTCQVLSGEKWSLEQCCWFFLRLPLYVVMGAIFAAEWRIAFVQHWAKIEDKFKRTNYCKQYGMWSIGGRWGRSKRSDTWKVRKRWVKFAENCFYQRALELFQTSFDKSQLIDVKPGDSHDSSVNSISFFCYRIKSWMLQLNTQ